MMKNTEIFLFLLLPRPACWLLLDVCKYYRTPGLVPGLLRTLCCRPRHREGGGHQEPRRGKWREKRNFRGSPGASEAGHGVHDEGDCASGIRPGFRVHWRLHSVQVRRDSHENCIIDRHHSALLTVMTRPSLLNRWKTTGKVLLSTSITFKTSPWPSRGPS